MVLVTSFFNLTCFPDPSLLLYISAFLSNNILYYGYTTFYLPIHQMMDICFFPLIFGYNEKFYENLCTCFCVKTYFSSLECTPRSEIAEPYDNFMLTIWRITRQIYKMIALIYIPTKSIWTFQFFTPLPIDFLRFWL